VPLPLSLFSANTNIKIIIQTNNDIQISYLAICNTFSYEMSNLDFKSL
jgi:hypothetical protein